VQRYTPLAAPSSDATQNNTVFITR
jgi:hypothetical protein